MRDSARFIEGDLHEGSGLPDGIRVASGTLPTATDPYRPQRAGRAGAAAGELREDRGGPAGAKYFNGRQPLEIVYREGGHSRSSAQQREAAIKKMSRGEKLGLLSAVSEQ